MVKTIYGTYISDKNVTDYIDFLINKVFALLPMFEESNGTTEYVTYRTSLIQGISGCSDLFNLHGVEMIEILSNLQCLCDITDHADYKRHILKACRLLSEIKEGVIKDGL